MSLVLWKWGLVHCGRGSIDLGQPAQTDLCYYYEIICFCYDFCMSENLFSSGFSDLVDKNYRSKTYYNLLDKIHYEESLTLSKTITCFKDPKGQAL